MAELTQGEVQALRHAILVLERLADSIGAPQSEKLRHAGELVKAVLTGDEVVEDALSGPD